MPRLTYINLTSCKVFLFTLIFSILLSSNVFASDQLPTGRTMLLDWDESYQGFSFHYQEPVMTKMDFLTADRGEKSFIHAFESPGVKDMGGISLSEVNQAPKSGYRNTV